MQSNTQVLNAGDTFLITSNMNIIQFSLIGLSDSASFYYLGTAPATDTYDASLAPVAIPFSGQVSYNSRVATNSANPWNNVTIQVSSGQVGLELLQN